jgi:hypothetical protein
MTSDPPAIPVVGLAAGRAAVRTVLAWADRDPTQPCDWAPLAKALPILEALSQSRSRLGRAARDLTNGARSGDAISTRGALRELASLHRGRAAASCADEQLRLPL